MTKPKKKLPWTKWYWSDWRAEEGLRACSLAARGLWAEMLALMDKAEPHGFLCLNGKPLTPQGLTNQIGGGATLEQVLDLAHELEEHGVFSRDTANTIYSRRMVRDAEKRADDVANGKTGGNPQLKKKR